MDNSADFNKAVIDTCLTVSDVASLTEFLSELEKLQYSHQDKVTLDTLIVKLPLGIQDTIKKYSQTVSLELMGIEIKKTISLFVPLKLTIAVSTSEEFIRELSEWSRTNIGPLVVLDFFVDPSVVGGVVIEFNGIYKDYSLSNLIAKTFQNRKNEIMQLIV